TCAAAAALAALRTLLTGTDVSTVEIQTPKGIRLRLPVEETRREGDTVTCAVRKDAGDDPDITNGLRIEAAVTLRNDRRDRRISIDGGAGVGRVTLPGLALPVGAAAINPVPRQMIERELIEELERADCPCGADVIIAIPGGEAVAERTFNPKLGIVGGLSVLGTSGIVEPMSQAALVESLRLEMRQKKETGATRLLLVPGNYGADFLRQQTGRDEAVKCGNYVGVALDLAAELGFAEVLLTGHLGKLIKLAGGIMNTHSRVADGRSEIMAACALRAGADANLARSLLDCATTDAMIDLLKASNILLQTMQEVGNRIQMQLVRRLSLAAYSTSAPRCGALLFTKQHGLLAATGPAGDWLRERSEGRK
ncbi:MAG: cobalamin biosynthesis protein CbiD, partial [Clostridia bacterium]|nr:cobalamin biosynthesis protein CbiD [Clostridia bacterium]